MAIDNAVPKVIPYLAISFLESFIVQTPNFFCFINYKIKMLRDSDMTSNVALIGAVMLAALLPFFAAKVTILLNLFERLVKFIYAA
jgi:hypothetical protein